MAGNSTVLVSNDSIFLPQVTQKRHKIPKFWKMISAIQNDAQSSILNCHPHSGQLWGISSRFHVTNCYICQLFLFLETCNSLRTVYRLKEAKFESARKKFLILDDISD